MTWSVIVTTHRRPALLERALRSLHSQDGVDVTTIVIADDHAADTRAAALRHLGPADVFIARGGAPGPALSRNLGIAVAASDYLLFLDDDDIAMPTLVSTLVTAAETTGADSSATHSLSDPS